MCGLFLAAVPAAAAAAELAWAGRQERGAYPLHAVAGLPTAADLTAWLALRQGYPYETFARLGGAFDARRDECLAAIEAWWAAGGGRLWWADRAHGAPFRALWAALGRLRYGRLVYDPRSGAGWWQGRPRRAPFPRRLHPVGTAQWGTITAAADQLAPPAVAIEASAWPVLTCCCYFGEDPDDPWVGVEVRPLLVDVGDVLAELVGRAAPGEWLVLEADEDFNEV